MNEKIIGVGEGGSLVLTNYSGKSFYGRKVSLGFIVKDAIII